MTKEGRIARLWARFWMRLSGPGRLRRIPTWLAGLATPPFTGRARLLRHGPYGYIAPSAVLAHPLLRLRGKVFLGERVLIFREEGGGAVELADRCYLLDDTAIRCGQGGSVEIGSRTVIQPHCNLSAFVAPIRIGSGVQIAPRCAFYSYDHGVLPGRAILEQPLRTRGPIEVGDDAWIGHGSIVLSGVRIGAGAVVGAGSVVTRDVPDGAIAMGAPARVVRLRSEVPDALARG